MSDPVLDFINLHTMFVCASMCVRVWACDMSTTLCLFTINADTCVTWHWHDLMQPLLGSDQSVDSFGHETNEVQLFSL